LEYLFWIAASLLFYTYAGYPCVLYLIHHFLCRPVKKGEDLPYFSMIIAAYNEEKDIWNKLRNTIDIDYPEGKLEVIVVSDHSTDETDNLVKRFGHGIRLLRTPVRMGKTGAQNLAIAEARGDILVFSDATTRYDRNSLRILARNFSDETVGGVEGRLIYYPSKTGFLGDKDLLKSYEAGIKTMEGRVWSGVGDNGACYAIRRNLCRFIREDLTSDFAAPLDVSRQGKRFVFEPDALSYEEASSSSGREFKRKIRTVRAGIHVFSNSLDLLDPRKFGWITFVLLSRKFCRWATGFLLIVLFLSNMGLLESLFYGAFFALQMMFYLSAITGIVLREYGDRVRILSIPKNFLLVSTAAICGIIDYFRSKSTEIWDTARNSIYIHAFVICQVFL
jgi:cellulose synthase/poly-beta-1,6-N-acetylglucosamine synthase-like glycosyltransferase